MVEEKGEGEGKRMRKRIKMYDVHVLTPPKNIINYVLINDENGKKKKKS